MGGVVMGRHRIEIEFDINSSCCAEEFRAVVKDFADHCVVHDDGHWAKPINVDVSLTPVIPTTP